MVNPLDNVYRTSGGYEKAIIVLVLILIFFCLDEIKCCFLFNCPTDTTFAKLNFYVGLTLHFVIMEKPAF